MYINKNDKAKIIYVYTNDSIETNDLKNELEEYANKNYRICIYESGKEELEKNMLNLVCNNMNF